MMHAGRCSCAYGRLENGTPMRSLGNLTPGAVALPSHTETVSSASRPMTWNMKEYPIAICWRAIDRRPPVCVEYRLGLIAHGFLLCVHSAACILSKTGASILLRNSSRASLLARFHADMRAATCSS